MSDLRIIIVGEIDRDDWEHNFTLLDGLFATVGLKISTDQLGAAGAKYYNEIILINVAGSLPVRINRQFQGGRKVGKMHQNVLVFYKGDPKAIKEFGEVQVQKIDEDE